MADHTDPSADTQPPTDGAGRSLTPARIAGFTGIFVATVLGGVALAAATAGDRPTEVVAVVDGEVPVLTSIGRGDVSPTSDELAGLLPPDPAAEAEAMRAALEDDPEALEIDGGLDPDDVDIGAVAAAVGGADPTVASAAVGGIADGGTVFGEDAPGSDDDSGATDPDADDAAAPDEPTRVPTLVDPCAGPEPVPGCSGVGGTVSLATVEAFRFNRAPILRLDAVTCTEPSRELDADEFIVQIKTNTLGSFTTSYRTAGLGGRFLEATADTPEVWRTALDDGTVLQAVTCVVARRPPGAETGAQPLEVEVHGIGDGDSGEARWVGLLELPAPPGPDREAIRRDGRPDISVVARTASTLVVDVPVGRTGERAEVSLVPRSPEATGGECGVVPPASRGVESTGISVRGIDEIVISDWVIEQYEVTAPEAGTYWVCVDWFDDFDPPNNLERASVPIETRGTPSLELVLAGWEQGRASGSQPSSARVVLLDAGEPCGAAEINDFGPQADRGDPRPLCRLDGFPTHIGIRTEPDFGGDAPLTQRALVPIPTSCGGVPDCTFWYAQTIKAPDRQVAGLVVVGLRLTGAPDATPVTIGGESPELADENEIPGPRLDFAGVSAQPDPADPGRGAIVTWRADRAVTGTVRLRPQYPIEGCSGHQREIDVAANDGTVTFDRLCPGVDYFVNFSLADADGNRTIYDVNNSRPIRGVSLVRRSGTLQMDSLPAEFDYELAFSETARNVEYPEGIVPTNIALEFPRNWGEGDAHEYRFRQWYDGRAYNELVCEKASDLGRSATGIPISFRGGEFRLVESRFHFAEYRPARVGLFDGARRRKCPSLANKFDKTPSDDACHVSIHGLTPIGDSNHIDAMLDGEPAVFRTRVNMCDYPQHYFEATVTVRIRQVLALRGG